MSRISWATARWVIAPTLRSVRWGEPAAAAMVGLAIVALVAARASGAEATAGGSPVLPLRVLALFAAAGVAYVVDDPAGSTLAASPTTRAWRRGTRVVVAALGAGALWVGALLILTAWGQSLPAGAAGGLALEAAALAAVAVAVALWAGDRAPDGRGGSVAAPALLVGMLAALVIQRLQPRLLTLLPFSPDDPSWVPAHGWWALILSLAALVVVRCCQDPATPRGVAARMGGHRRGGGRRPGPGRLRPLRVPGGAAR